MTVFITVLFLSGLVVPSIGAILGMFVLGTLLVAIDRRRAWALDAATRICLIVVVLGVLRTILDLGSGRGSIPLDAIASLVVLSRRPPAEAMPTLEPGDRGTAILVAVGYLLTSSLWVVVMLLSGSTAR
jgi:hypothetical protein